MKQTLRRHISRVLAAVMTTCTVLTNFTGFEVAAAGKTIDVWDFGGNQESDALYVNHIAKSSLDAMTLVGDTANSGNTGKFLEAGDIAFDGDLILNVAKNDRLYYGEGESRSYGTFAKANVTFPDGYASNGCWYANGAGSETTRCFTFTNLKAGDGITAYTGTNNGVDMYVYFTGNGETQSTLLKDGAMTMVNFIAEADGQYKLWYSADGKPKPVMTRLTRTPAADVSGKIDLKGNPVSGYSLSFLNQTTKKTVAAQVSGDTYTASLTPGYTYTAVMSGAVGYGFTNDTKTVSVTKDDLASGKTADLDVEVKSTYKISGKVTGFESGYDTSKLTVTFVADKESLADDITADLTSDLGYSATLEPDIAYTVELSGVNDYEITAGGSSNANGDVAQDIQVAPKAIYNVSGSFLGLDGASVSTLSFVNVDDDYSYGAAVTSDGYNVQLRDGSYLAVTSVSGRSTRTHVVVNGEDTIKDLLFVANPYVAPTVTYSSDVYVGCADKTPNYTTIGEAMEAVKAMNPTSEAQRITVHIAPGTYREQISIETPYITFVKEGSGEVKLTWYYGIGYKYYSSNKSTGFYNEEDAFDQYEKHPVQKWGAATYVKAAAKAFRAEGITFEASFNKYVTDEEIIDGVEIGDKTYVRTLGANVTSKDSTERSTALVIEGDDCEFKDCKMLGSQDTLYIGGSVVNSVYFKDCTIEGNTDYIFGAADAVFDGCELRFFGYSDRAEGGHITAARKDGRDGYHGFLFRSCTITRNSEMLQTAGSFGRPWDQNAAVYFFNTKLESEDVILTSGWSDWGDKASDAKAALASYKEYGTTYAGNAVDTSARTQGTVQADASGADPSVYFGDWTPYYYAKENGKPAFETGTDKFPNGPYFNAGGGDVLIPSTGDTFTVKYSLGANDDSDASRIDYYIIAQDNTETLVKTTSAVENEGLLLTNSMLEGRLKAVVTPILYSGAQGESVVLTIDNPIEKGSGYREATRPSGKTVIFLASDSTVKDYSATGINNTAGNRSEGSWGEFLPYFVNNKYEVMNYAQGGRSARNFIDGTSSGNDRYLDKIKADMTEGDYLFVQFGHNDSDAGYPDRYSPVGTPDANGVYPSIAPTSEGAGDGTFKWYLEQFVEAANAVGAHPVMVTPVSRLNYDANGNITSHHGSHDEYVIVTKQVAEENNIPCIDLYTLSKEIYEEAYKADPNSAARLFYQPGEKTHHSKLGGFLMAAVMANRIEDISEIEFSDSIVKPASLSAANAKGVLEFKVWANSVFEGYQRTEDNSYDEKAIDQYWTDIINGYINDIGAAPVSVSYGDVNEDGALDVEDSAATFQYVLNPASVSINTQAADVDGENGIDVADAAEIFQKVLVSTYKFPVERTAA